MTLVTVLSGDPDYKAVVDEFKKARLRFSVLKVDRVVNPALEEMYKATKDLMDKTNGPGINNEARLWHGRSAKTVSKIVKDGYSRSYSADNNAFGRAVYFCKRPNIATYTKHATVGRSGIQKIIWNRVLVGKAAKGRPDLMEPPLRRMTGNRFDSVCDDPNHPNIFAIFRDWQAMPEFIVTIKKKESLQKRK